jgi:hypothetical protein
MKILSVVSCLVLVGCRCEGPVTTLKSSFRVEGNVSEVDFGRVLEGQVARLKVRISADTRLAVNVKGSTQTPFAVDEMLLVPGGDALEVEVRFQAANGAATGLLRLVNTDDETNATEIKLKGFGVRPLDCKPSAPCRESRYDFDTNACIETITADEVACETKNLCLNMGRCLAGACLGEARKCDDANPCTDDGCAMDLGCVYTPHRCPVPTNNCRAATCNPASGCGEANQADGTVCGGLDCTNANLCVLGACKVLPTPDGTPCSPEIACLPMGTCQKQKCTIPDAGPWLPDWSVELPQGTNSDLVFGQGNLFFSSCAAELGGLDGGPLDGGFLADANRCQLVSYTATGFERFSRPVPGVPRTLAVSAQGIAVQEQDGGVSWRTFASGAELVPIPSGSFSVADGFRYVLDAQGTLTATSSDAGTLPLASLGQSGLLALDLKNQVYSFEADSGRLLRFQLGDAGVLQLPETLTGSLNTLSVSGEVALVANQWLIRERDGGLVATALDAGEPLLLSLLSAGVGALFTKGCQPLTTCLRREPELLTFDVATAEITSQALVSEALNVRLHSATFVSAPVLVPPVALVLSEDSESAGRVSLLSVFGDGKRLLRCEFLPEQSDVQSVEFSDSTVFVLSAKPDGGAQLGAYPLKALRPDTKGWSRENSRSGLRAEQP